MSISNSVNKSYEFKKNIYPFVYYFENKIIEIDHEFYDKNLKWYINLLKESSR